MTSVLVTGARGFLGRNLVARLRMTAGVEVWGVDEGDDMWGPLREAEVVYHLAGVNRPKEEGEFERVNAGLTRALVEKLEEWGRRPLVVFASSIQAELENAYGRSKRAAEEVLAGWGGPVRVYRLKNLFGKFSRPNYNSVVATFCHKAARGEELEVHDGGRELELSYVDDVVDAMVGEMRGEAGAVGSFRVTVGELAERIRAIAESRKTLVVPDMGDRLTVCLRATYLSYVPAAEREVRLEVRRDERGSLAEFLKTEGAGQIFVSRTAPGVTRGNHYHETKTEKFFVVEGEGLLKMRRVDGEEVEEYRLSGGAYQVVDIPPGWTHSITNVGEGEMVTLFWASEIFDPGRPDTYFLAVEGA
ncbi:MAG: NAD-dependent epimerase/dehydratase family protein [Bryobacteraceae bacterium]|nr:NAD-dependent epimerase/dehydratase family protein [Bryobacteraceae bacterium]